MRTSVGDIRSVIRQGGGVREWLWKGGKDALASVELVPGNLKGSQALRHTLSFREKLRGFQLADERLGNDNIGLT